MLLAKYKAENRQIKSILIPIKKSNIKECKIKKKKKKKIKIVALLLSQITFSMIKSHNTTKDDLLSRM